MDDINIKDYYYDEAKTMPKYKQEVKEGRLEHPKLAKYKRSDKYDYVEQKWNIIDDVADNDFTPLINHITTQIKSIVINGRAGCGKTTLVKGLQEALTKQGILFESLAPTNKACNLIKGMTIHRFILSQTRKSISDMEYKYLFIDEVSMMSEKFYKFFVTLKRMRPDINFIISGDFNQLLPVNDRIKDCDYEHSAALHELVDGNRLNLTTCRRSDREVYQMCLAENINHINKNDFTHNQSKTNICFTNATRKQINAEIMKKEIEANKKGAKSKVVHLKAFCLRWKLSRY